MLILCLTQVNEYRVRTDNELLDGCIAGIAAKDTAALARLYRETGKAVYGFALSVLKNTQDAEDVLHDCFLAIYSGAGEYRSADKPMAWILTITRNLCLQRLRERKRTTDIPEEDWERCLKGCDGAAPEERLFLAECMSMLSDEERQIVVLHAVAGFKHREIGKLLELPLSTVLSKYNRALKKLKEFIMKGERQE